MSASATQETAGGGRRDGSRGRVPAVVGAADHCMRPK